MIKKAPVTAQVVMEAIEVFSNIVGPLTRYDQDTWTMGESNEVAAKLTELEGLVWIVWSLSDMHGMTATDLETFLDLPERPA